MITFATRTDHVGAVAGSLCLVHCAITPFVFIAQTCSATCCEDSPLWWQTLDFAFLIISFFAIYQTTRTSDKSWLKIAFWASWFILLITLSNEQLGIIPINRVLVYVPAISIVALHIYNLMFCRCAQDQCCINTNENG